MPTYYEVTIVTHGALESVEEFDQHTAAITYAEKERDSIINEAIKDWQIYISPHYHSQGDAEECTCRQYDTDHTPDYSSNHEEL